MQTKEHIDLANSMTKITRTGHLYGKLFALKDMQIYLLKEEKKIKDEIETIEKGQKWVKYEWTPNLEIRF